MLGRKGGERGEWEAGGRGRKGNGYVCDCKGGATGKYCERGEWERGAGRGRGTVREVSGRVGQVLRER